jgi:hypothetical protein
MSILQRFTLMAAGAALVAGAAVAQDMSSNIISAKAGVIGWAEGDVQINGKLADAKLPKYDEVKEGQVLSTTEGRAEVLLSPGVFLRVAENSSVKMISSRLVDTRMELLGGSILVEAAELDQDNHLTFLLAGTTVELQKKGLYRLDAEGKRLRVYDGEVIVTNGANTVTVKEGRQADISAAVVMPEKFDNKTGDAFYRWASRRAQAVAAANVAAARRAGTNGYAFASNAWIFNPFLGMYTYMPYRGIYNSPFGCRFYSARSAANINYAPNYGSGMNSGFNGGMSSGPYFDSNRGYTVTTRSDPGFSSGAYSGGGGGVSSGGGAAAAPAPSARGGDSGTARSSGGRGR